MTGIPQGGSGQIIGRREEQQDALGFGTVVLVDGRQAPLTILADGMGGHHGGAIAARLAIETFLGACRASPARTFTGALESALFDANRALAARSSEDFRLTQMGCTLMATAIEGGVLHYISVGDSLLWRIGVNRIERLNADHSMTPLVTAALAQGRMTHAEAQAHGSILRSAVTGRPIELIDLRSVEVARDEWVLMASDGILTLDEAGLHSLVRPGSATAQARVDAVLDAVEQAGEPEQDNCTLALVPMISVSAKPTRRPVATAGAAMAIIAGLGVVGAAGWELIRTDRPPASAASKPALAKNPDRLGEVAPVPRVVVPDEGSAPAVTRPPVPTPAPSLSPGGSSSATRNKKPTPKQTLTPTPSPKPSATPTPGSTPAPAPKAVEPAFVKGATTPSAQTAPPERKAPPKAPKQDPKQEKAN